MSDSGYPNEPGWRTGPNAETSKEGAMLAAKTAGPMKHRVIAYLGEGPATPEQLVGRFRRDGEVVLLNTIRARTTDLFKLGVVCPSGTYGLGESGKVRVIHWRLMSNEERGLFNARKAAEAEKTGDA